MEQHQSPESSQNHLSQSFPDQALPGIDGGTPDEWILPEELRTQWDTLTDFYFCSSEPSAVDWHQWTTLESQPLGTETQAYSSPQMSDAQNELPQDQVERPDSLLQAQPPGLDNVSQWLEGSFHPSKPCSHCRRHRLQCLIIRTTYANPNPVNACSSCVALFRECSLAKGEKRLPSGFETYSPVSGHLHGLPENAEANVGHFKVGTIIT